MNKYTMENDFIRVSFLDIGGIITEITKLENNTNYLLSYQNWEENINNSFYMNAIIGRSAGRTSPLYYINHKGNKVMLDANEGGFNHLHGGEFGYHNKVWDVRMITTNHYELTYFDNDSPYEPANLVVDYKIVDNRFIIEMKGESSEPTVFNLTNHNYFNLDQEKNSIGDHWLKLAPCKLQLIDSDQIATGGYLDLENSEYFVYNFEEEKQVKVALNQENDLAKLAGGGMDFAFIFDDLSNQPQVQLFNEDKSNGLEIYSNQESTVIYTMGSVEGDHLLEGNLLAEPFMGITFEMQKRPNFVHLSQENYLEDSYRNVCEYVIL